MHATLRLVLPVCGVAALAAAAIADDAVRGRAPTLRERLDAPLLPVARWQDPAAAAPGGSFEDLLAIKEEISQEAVQLRVGGYVWHASVDRMEAQSSQKDIRAGRGRGYRTSSRTGADVTAINTRDFEKDFGLDTDPRVIVNPEVSFRFGNNVVRMSWWSWTESGGKFLDDNIAFGDRSYLKGGRIDGDMEMHDAKLIFEYRFLANKKLNLFAGLSFHALIYQVDFVGQDTIGWDKNGLPFGGGDVAGIPAYQADSDNDGVPEAPYQPANAGPGGLRSTEKEPGNYALVTFSLRAEFRPAEQIRFSFDSQSMYTPWAGGLKYGYTDTKIAMWVQFSRFVYLGFGYRIWAAEAHIHRLGKNKTIFDGYTVLSGGFGAIYFEIP